MGIPHLSNVWFVCVAMRGAPLFAGRSIRWYGSFPTAPTSCPLCRIRLSRHTADMALLEAVLESRGRKLRTIPLQRRLAEGVADLLASLRIERRLQVNRER